MTQADAVGRHIAGRYELGTPLGRGGMGTVWRARDTLLNRTVAIKQIEIPRQLPAAEASAVRARAMREARSAARLAHPAVVTIYDVLQEENRSFIVMEFVDASTLEEVVQRRGPLPPEEAANIALDVLDALETAHANGIVHRDVKPSNVMITETGRAKLADFGIATVKGDPKLTSTGMILGSPQFMAPEQASGTESGPATDLWALGATLYFAVEGRYPFDRGEAIPTLAAVVHDDFFPMERAGALGPIISWLLDKRPEHRPTAEQARRSLISGAHAFEPVSSSPPTAAPGEPRKPAAPRSTRPPMARRSRRLSPLLLTAALLLVFGAAGLLWLTLGGQENPGNSGRDRAGANAGDGQADSQADGNTSEGNAATSASEGTDSGTPSEGNVTETVASEPVPGEWTTYRDPGSGYELSYPDGWDLIQDAPNSIDFRDPSTGTYLRVQWTTSPGRSPKGAWKKLAKSFAASHEDYEEIAIASTTYKGYKAAEWEFTYSEGGAHLHAVDLGFVIGHEYGVALYFQTHEEDWDASQQLLEQLKVSFQPPSA